MKILVIRGKEVDSGSIGLIKVEITIEGILEKSDEIEEFIAKIRAVAPVEYSASYTECERVDV